MVPVVYSTEPRRALLATVGATVAGALAGVFVPSLPGIAGAAGARALLVFAVAMGALVGRGGGAILFRAAVAGVVGAVAGAASRLLPPGVELALVGLGVGLALGGYRVARALPAAAGAVAGAALAGALDPRPSGALLGAATALGIGVAELLGTLVVASERPPSEVEDARARLDGAGRALVETASDAWARLVRAAGRDALDESVLDEGRRLLLTVARASLEARDLARASLGLVEASRGVADDEVDEACARLRTSLDRRAAAARAEAVEAAGRLVDGAARAAERT